MRIPVVVVAGFLDTGKTTIAREILKRSGKPEEWLVLICEHGEEAYGEEYETVSIDAMEDLDFSFLRDLIEKYPGRRFLLEYNGTWPLTSLYQIRLPSGMVIQNVTYVLDGSTAEVYIRNMGPMLLEQMNFADCFFFTNCHPNDKVDKLLRQLNQKAVIVDDCSDEGIGMIVKSFRDDLKSPLESLIYSALLIVVICIVFYYVNSF